MVVEHVFPVMGTSARLLAVPSYASGGAAAVDLRLLAVRAWLSDAGVRLTRFEATSDLGRLNADPRALVPAGPLLCQAVAAARWAAARTGGLVDPTLEPDLVAAGYATSWRDERSVPLERALVDAPSRRPARPRAGTRWRDVHGGDGRVGRPLGVRLDLGGTAKGLAVDLAASRLADLPAFAVDCGGDLVAGGTAAAGGVAVAVEHPLSGLPCATVRVRDGAVATSALARRIWRRADGAVAHHLLDPSTGAPAWTGLISATALAPTALEAEALAKAALLSGPHGAAAWLRPHGGLVVDDAGDLHLHGAVEVES